MSTTKIFDEIQKTNPSAIIELFTLQLDNGLHGATTTYRFHAGSNLNANGEIVWAGNSYLRFPVEATGFAFQRGKLPRPKIKISNALGTLSAILLTVNQTTAGNDLTGSTVTRIQTMAKFLDAVNFSGNSIISFSFNFFIAAGEKSKLLLNFSFTVTSLNLIIITSTL